jgi:TrmH family RNA methyltransferase
VVIGNEGQGVQEDIVKLADIQLRIPGKGEADSLNAAVATGIILFAMTT